MRTQLRWTNRARKELKEIYKWIARDRPATAERVYQQIEQRSLILIEQPLCGQSRPDLGPGIRVLVASPYLIFHQVLAEPETGTVHSVEIVRILHGGMDLGNRF